jgi:hypothetical protein
LTSQEMSGRVCRQPDKGQFFGKGCLTPLHTIKRRRLNFNLHEDAQVLNLNPHFKKQ